MRKIYTCLDIGSFNIKLMVVENINNSFHVLAATNTRTKGFSKGYITDKDEFLKSLLKAKISVEELLGIEINKTLVVIPSVGLDFSIVSEDHEFKNKKDITTNDIDLVKSKIVKYHSEKGKKIITISPISFHISGKDVKDPLGQTSEFLALKAVVTSSPTEYLSEIVTVIEESGFKVVSLGYQTLGDYYEAKTKAMDKEKTAVINLGHEMMEVAIFNKGIMIKNERIDFGTNILENDIARIYNLKKSVARSLKENFAVSNTRYASTDKISVVDKTDTTLSLSQLEISEIAESRIMEMLKLAKKQINVLTNREISYIIITGGITELTGFSYTVENVFDRRAQIMNVNTIGARNNIYSSCLGMIKYFVNKNEFSSKKISMFDEKQISDLSNNNGEVDNNIINKVFDYFN